MFVINQLTRIRKIYADAFEWYNGLRTVPPIHVSFYPYIGINHTIRIRDGEIFVRICEMCREMPLPCQKGLAYILVGKLLRRKIPDGANEVYNAYIKSDFIREKAAESKKERSFLCHSSGPSRENR